MRASASDWLRFHVARDGVLLFKRTPGAWTEFKAGAMLRYWEVAPIIALTAEGVRRRLKREAEERARERGKVSKPCWVSIHRVGGGELCSPWPQRGKV